MIKSQTCNSIDNEFFNELLDDDNDFELYSPEPIEPLVEYSGGINSSHKQNPIVSNKVISPDFSNNSGKTKRASENINSRMDSVLAGLIGQRIQTKALPLALRKRLMYERACSG